MVLNKTLDKRTSKAKIIFDIEDIRILKLLDELYKKNEVIKFNKKKYRKMYHIKGLSETLNVSHNSLLIHINRLSGLKLISILSEIDLGYKYKYLQITEKGEKVLNLLLTNNEEVFINGKLVNLWK